MKIKMKSTAITLTAATFYLYGCGGGDGSLADSANGQAPPTGGQTPPNLAVKVVAPVLTTTYSCDSAATASTCESSIYTFLRTISSSAYEQVLKDDYAANIGGNTALMACKPSVACANDWGSGIGAAQVEEMKRAATAVVRISMPNDHLANGQTAGLGLSAKCTGVAVKGSKDESVYILTAAHCLYEEPLYPNMRYSSYRSAGVPVYVTFFYEKSTCGGQMDFQSFGPRTVPSIVVAHNYSLNGWSAPNWNQISGGVTDFALLKLAGPLPNGVTPITYSARTLASSDKLFTFSHPLGLDKVGGMIDRGADFVGSTGFQYQVSASRRLTEPGSSGGPLFAYDSEKNIVTVIATQSGAGPNASPTNTCGTTQSLSYARLDSHADFLNTYLGR